MIDEVIGALLIIAGIIAYLHITRVERAQRRARREKIKAHRRYVKRFKLGLDEADEYFNSLRDNRKQRIKCQRPELLQAGEKAYRERERRERNI